MRIVFFGSPAAALPSLRGLIEAGHTVELVVTQPDKPAGRGRKVLPSAVKSLARERGFPVIEPAKIRTDETALERVRTAAPDVNVVVAYGQIIPNAVHSLPRHRSLNVHFSLLPKYRGAAPVQWTILNGDAESGVTIIELNDRMDEGDILAVKRVPVGPRETARELEDRLAGLGAAKTKVRIVTSPSYTRNIHEVEIRGEFGTITSKTENVPSATNPKTSRLAVFSAIATLDGITRSIKVGT